MTTMPTRRNLATLAVAALAIAGVGISAGTSGATSSFALTRYAGSDRYDTAAKAAIDTFGTADTVILASGANYADALSASYAAGTGVVPVLLTAPSTLPTATGDALTALKTTQVAIVGGTASVGTSVEAALKERGIKTSRVAGNSRYETAQKVATDAGPGAVGHIGSDTRPTALLVSGESFPDALSAGPMSFAAHLPIILTQRATLSPEAQKALTDLKITRVIVVGGEAAVSTAAEASVKAMGIATERLAGADRTDTAVRVADFEVASLGWAATHVDLSRGDDFADALAGAAHSGKRKAPALLTVGQGTLGSFTKTWISDHAATLTDGHINGGTNAVSQAAQDEATAAGRTSSSTSSTLVSSSTTSTSTSTSSSTTSSSTTSTTTVCTVLGLPVPCP
jgi:putative cell wall-binding protein